MSTGNIYKRFCIVLMLMGLVLCSGMYVYAHNSKLTKVINESRINPTIKNLEHLVCLFEEDVEYHQSRGETIEAKRSKAMAVSIKVEIAIKTHDDLKEENYEEIIALLKLESDLWNDAGDAKRATDSFKHMKQCEAKLGSLRTINALLKAKKDTTMDNWEVVSELSREESVLYNEIGEKKRAKYLLARASEFKATGAFYKAKENSTIENWTETAELYGEAFKACVRVSDSMSARECMKGIACADKMIISLGGEPVGPPVSYDCVILENDLEMDM